MLTRVYKGVVNIVASALGLHPWLEGDIPGWPAFSDWSVQESKGPAVASAGNNFEGHCSSRVTLGSAEVPS